MSTEHAEPLEWLESKHPEHAPWSPRSIAAPPGGPSTLYDGAGAVAWFGTAGRIASEREGYARADGHPASPRVVGASERSILFAPFHAVAEPSDALVLAWRGASRSWTGTRRRWLGEHTTRNVVRALDGVVKGRALDRWLDRSVAFETAGGPSFGGVHRSWLFDQDSRTVCLRGADASTDGGWALDVAGLALAPTDLERLREVHRESAVDPEAADRALDLALVLVWMREHVRSRDVVWADRARAIVEADRAPDRVRVFVDAPSFVPVDAWIEAQGATVDASRARWLLQHVDGIVAFGEPVRVRTEPPIAKGRKSPPREDRSERRRRLFARFDDGIRADDEGLFSATPEELAMRVAHGARGTVIDGTCGIGALAIAYARQPRVERVIAVDVDAQRLAMARHNARIYGVQDRIEFVHADLMDVLDRPADLVVIDPPWGGRDYDRDRITLADLSFPLAAAVERIEGEVVLKLPRSFDRHSLPSRGWTWDALIDRRGILKFMVARGSPGDAR